MFFDAIGGDRVYNASDFNDYFAHFIGNGVFGANTSGLLVAMNTGMNLTVSPGSAFINGCLYVLDANKTVTIDAADSILNRKDLIVLQRDNINRLITIKVKKGTPASTPTAPTVQRDVNIYELALAQVTINKGVTQIVTANLVDKRSSIDCGWVTGLISQVDTSGIFNEFQATLDQNTALYEEQWNSWFTGAKELDDPNKQNKVTYGSDYPANPNDGDLHFLQVENYNFDLGITENTFELRRFSSVYNNWSDKISDYNKLDKSGGDITGTLKVQGNEVLTNANKLEDLSNMNILNPVAGDRLEFDGNDWVNKGKRYHQEFQGAATAITSRTWTKLDFGTNSPANWDATNKAIKVPKTATYLINAVITFDAIATAGAKINLQWDVNGVLYNGTYAQAPNVTNSAMSLTISRIVDLNANDLVAVRSWTSAGTATAQASNWTHINIQEI
jgi:hypothetical protein